MLDKQGEKNINEKQMFIKLELCCIYVFVQCSYTLKNLKQSFSIINDGLYTCNE